MSFEIGSRVRVSNPLPEKSSEQGQIGTVESIAQSTRGDMRLVRLVDCGLVMEFHTVELEPVRERKARPAKASKAKDAQSKKGTNTR